MTAVAVDLTPVVDALIERPFDRPTLDKVYSTVEGHPHAYATALRCAAKRTEDPLAAAYWLTEAARVHELVDDLGGSIALLSRARDCDPENPRTRELLAACMTRLAVRVGLDFSFSSTSPQANEAARRQHDDSGLPLRRESGLRPPAPERHRDTLPDLFGIDGEESGAPIDVVAAIPSEPSPATHQPSPVAEAVSCDVEATNPEPAPKPPSSPLVFKLARRVAPMLPPMDPEVPVPTLAPSAPEDEPMLRAIADIAMSTRRSSELVARREPVLLVASAPPPVVVAAFVPDDVYGDPTARKTVRPVGDRLVGELFEALHGFHFLDDVREGAAFLGHVLEEKMRPATVLVHVYDINSGHFVVMSASGSRAAALVDYATPEDEPFVVEIMNDDEATLVLQPGDDPRLSRGRWLLAEPLRSVLCAPCAIENRYLGLVELIDPLDGSEFDEDDRNALTYAASAFAKFLDRRGIVLSEDEPSVQTSVSPQAFAPSAGL
jgi:hypothetical protein